MSVPKCISCHQAIVVMAGRVCCVKVISIASIQHTLPVITTMASWQLVYLGLLIYSYILPVFENPKGAQVTTTATSILNIEEECGLKKHNCTTCHKAIITMTGRACCIIVLNKKVFQYLLTFFVKAICLYSLCFLEIWNQAFIKFFDASQRNTNVYVFDLYLGRIFWCCSWRLWWMLPRLLIYNGLVTTDLGKSPIVGRVTQWDSTTFRIERFPIRIPLLR